MCGDRGSCTAREVEEGPWSSEGHWGPAAGSEPWTSPPPDAAKWTTEPPATYRDTRTHS